MSKDLDWVRSRLVDCLPTKDLRIPPLSPSAGGPYGTGNLQTDRLLDMLGLNHIWTEPYLPHPNGPICSDSWAAVSSSHVDASYQAAERDLSGWRPPLPPVAATNDDRIRASETINFDSGDELEEGKPQSLRAASFLNLPPPKFNDK